MRAKDNSPQLDSPAGKKSKKRRKDDKISVFSIGAKLVIIISFLVVLSLGSITALVSYLVIQDVRLAAEDNNFEINRRSAVEAEKTFVNIMSHCGILKQVINSTGDQSELTVNVAKTFFYDNPEIAAIAFFDRDSQVYSYLFNDDFFSSRDIDKTLAENWFYYNSFYFERESPQAVIVNVTSYFSIHILGFIFHQDEAAAAVLFSPETLTKSFSFGTNKSYFINGNDNILIHPDFEMVRDNTNITRRDFIRTMRRTAQRNLQTFYTDEDGEVYFGAFAKLNTGGVVVITSIGYDKVFEGIVATTWRNIYLTVSVLFISILFVWFYSKSISIPLKRLAIAAQKIEGGVFEIELKSKSKDEIGLLTNSFQKMSRALGIFGRFTNKEIALLAMRGQIKPGGLPKHATIFFSDIRGFTEKSEIFTNEFGASASDKIVYWLNDYLSSMVDCVEKTGGTIDKFIGDAVMAHWGTATTSGNPRIDALNCIKAALMMRLAVVKLNKNRNPSDKGNPEINIGCGINTGMVTAGQIGSEQRMEYTVIGDPVNLASRVESLCKPLAADILISEDTWLLVRDHIICEEMQSVQVKGKEKPVRLFAVINHLQSKQKPFTLADVRKLMNIKPPDTDNVDLNAEEKNIKLVTIKSEVTKKIKINKGALYEWNAAAYPSAGCQCKY